MAGALRRVTAFGRASAPGRRQKRMRRAAPVTGRARRRTTAQPTRWASVRQCQALAVSAASFCSTSSPSIMIWISSLTTNLPSSIMLKLKPNSFLFICP